MLSQALVAELSKRQISVIAKARSEQDLSDTPGIRALLHDSGAAVVWNAAAFTDVDGCEEHRDYALEVNGKAVGRLAEVCSELGSHLVHVSSDYVFGDEQAGSRDSPIPVDAPTHPDSVYGESKLLGETLAIANTEEPLIVRASWLFGPGGKNFARTIAGAAAERAELRVVDDQRGAPTYTPFLAEAMVDLLLGGASGIWHYRNRPAATWFDFACAIVARTGADCRVVPVTTDEFPRPARRPSYSVLDVSATEERLGPLPEWSAGLDDYFEVAAAEQVAGKEARS